jgi:hypothetical protein
MLKAVTPVIKAANPNAKVVFGGISYDNFIVEDGGIFVREFFDDVLAAGGGDYFDIMNLHYYPFHNHRRRWTQSDSSGLVEKIAEIQGKLAAKNLTKELMITEIGWHSNNLNGYPSDEEYQSRYVVQLLTQAAAANAIAIIWWPLTDAGDYPYRSGLATDTNTTKASYRVYQEAVRRIGAASNLRVVIPATVTNDLEVYESREARTNKVQYIAWLNPIAPFNAEAVPTFNDGVTQNWEAPGNRATLYAKDGTLIQTLNDGDDGKADGKVTVRVTRSPLYIVMD